VQNEFAPNLLIASGVRKIQLGDKSQLCHRDEKLVVKSWSADGWQLLFESTSSS
jgi:hypothetical protein